MAHIKLVVHSDGKELTTYLDVPSSEKLSSILKTVLSRHNLPTNLLWEVRWKGRLLELEKTLAQVFPNIEAAAGPKPIKGKVFHSDSEFELTIDQRGSNATLPKPSGWSPVSKTGMDGDLAREALEGDRESSDFDLAIDDGSADESGSEVMELSEDGSMSGEEPAPRRKSRVSQVDTPSEEMSMDLLGAAGEDEPLPEDDEELGSQKESARTRRTNKSPKKEKRHATVRYYSRMNPQKTYPLQVVISEKDLEKIRQKHVDQKSQTIHVEKDAILEIEPILPGCACYPTKRHVSVREKNAEAKFWVVPHFLGEVIGAYIDVRQLGQSEPLTEIPLEIKVVNRKMAVLLSLFSMAFPFLSLLLKRFQLDAEAQAQEFFQQYPRLLPSLLQPKLITAITVALFLLAIVIYRRSAAKEEVVFWEVIPVGPRRFGKTRSLFGWLSRKAKDILVCGASGGLLAGIVGGILLGIIAVNSNTDRAIASAPVVLTLALSFGVISGGIIGAIEGGEE